jgi:hypothetical protein
MKTGELTKNQIQGLLEEINEWNDINQLIAEYTKSIQNYRVGSPMWNNASLKTNWLVQWKRNMILELFS